MLRLFALVNITDRLFTMFGEPPRSNDGIRARSANRPSADKQCQLIQSMRFVFIILQHDDIWARQKHSIRFRDTVRIGHSSNYHLHSSTNLPMYLAPIFLNLHLLTFIWWTDKWLDILGNDRVSPTLVEAWFFLLYS